MVFSFPPYPLLLSLSTSIPPSAELTELLSSGIGRSVAILMAREGADITIVYLPEEQEDAEATKKSVENEKRSCLLVPGDLMANETCKKAVDEHIKKSAASTLSFLDVDLTKR